MRIPTLQIVERDVHFKRAALLDRLWNAFSARHRQLSERLVERNKRCSISHAAAYELGLFAPITSAQPTVLVGLAQRHPPVSIRCHRGVWTPVWQFAISDVNNGSGPAR